MALSQNKISKKKQKNLRNILGLKEKTFWQAPSESERLALNSKLESCLKDVRIDIPRVPFSTSRLLSKEDREKANRELLMSQTPEKIKAYHYALKLRQFLFLGINSLCRGIEQNKVSACLMDADVSPKILITHAVELAKNSKVPFLTVPNLKETLKRTIGFSSMAIGFQKDVLKDNSHIFHEVCTYIIEVAKSIEACNKDINENLKISTTIPIVLKKTKIEVPKTPLDIPSLLDNIYLFRESENMRVFKPPTNNDSQTSLTTDIEIPEADTIKLSSSSVDTLEKVTKIRYFKPLIVKRIQSNPNKKKKKFKKKDNKN